MLREQRQDLRALANAQGLIWGGLYGRELPYSLRDLMEMGYAEEVAHRHTVRHVTFDGGYRITPEGRRALARQKEGGENG